MGSGGAEHKQQSGGKAGEGSHLAWLLRWE